MLSEFILSTSHFNVFNYQYAHKSKGDCLRNAFQYVTKPSWNNPIAKRPVVI